MANFADRVAETTSTAGTGTITLAGAVAAYQSFAASGIVSGTVVAYRLIDGNNWEVGYGTYTTGFLSRDTVTASSSGTALITLSGGSTSVVCTGLAAAFDWPTVATTVTATDVLTIPVGRQLLMADNLTILGSVIAFGDIAIL